MLNELTYEQYHSTFSGKMNDVTDTAISIVDIWPYIEQLVKKGDVLEYVYNNKLVELVYQNNTATYHHVLLPVGDKDIFVVIIIDLLNKKISGHYNLHLKKLYGLE